MRQPLPPAPHLNAGGGGGSNPVASQVTPRSISGFGFGGHGLSNVTQGHNLEGQGNGGAAPMPGSGCTPGTPGCN